MAKNDGGQAFPSGSNTMGPPYEYGMTLRDWFAGQIAAGMMASNSPPSEYMNQDRGEATRARFAEIAYAVADAMIAEREKQR